MGDGGACSLRGEEGGAVDGPGEDVEGCVGCSVRSRGGAVVLKGVMVDMTGYAKVEKGTIRTLPSA